MNLMLVDGDSENIKNFRAHIKGKFPGIRVSGAFSEITKDIMPAVRELKPDVILADIRFFGGLHFGRFKSIHEAFPDTRFVMYGTFNESDYMKRGRDFGVLDFMYRPVKPSELNRCLNMALENYKRIQESKRQDKLRENDYHDRMFQFKEIFLRSLLNGDIDQEREAKDGFDYFNIPFTNHFAVLIIRIDHYRRAALALSEMEKHMKAFNILETTLSVLSNYNAVAFVRGFHEIPIIINGDFSVEEKVLLGDKLKHTIFDKTKTRVTVGIGRTYEQPMEIAISAREADATFGYRYRMGYNSVIAIEFVEPNNNITYRYPSARERRLVYSAVVGDFDYAKGILSELFNALSQCGEMPENLIAKTVMTIVFRISRYVGEQNLPFAAEVSRFFPTSEILKIVTIDDGYTFLENSLQEFCKFVRDFQMRDSLRLHMVAKRYIAEHYYENFSIAKIAVKLGTTPETINKVFMERERVMLFDYVMWVRVQEAQKRLQDSATEEDVIAVQIGFDDVKYFRSVFKKYVGEMPAEYRARHQQAPAE